MTDTQKTTFAAARVLLAEYVPPLVVIKDVDSSYQLTTGKPAVIWNKKRDSVWFAGLEATKAGVTLHFMPAYMNEPLQARLSPVFMKTLKGQACFHLGNFDEELQRATAEALRLGVEEFQKSGYLD